jgi:hypothetical protein
MRPCHTVLTTPLSIQESSRIVCECTKAFCTFSFQFVLSYLNQGQLFGFFLKTSWNQNKNRECNLYCKQQGHRSPSLFLIIPSVCFPNVSFGTVMTLTLIHFWRTTDSVNYRIHTHKVFLVVHYGSWNRGNRDLFQTESGWCGNRVFHSWWLFETFFFLLR